MTWVYLMLLATFLWAVSNVIDKILSTNYLRKPIALTATFGIPGLLISFILFLFVGIPTIPLMNLLAAFLAGVFLMLGIISYLKSLSIEEASRVVPLWHLSPLFTLILAMIFLNEILTAMKYYAFASILIGGFLISTRKIGKVFHLSPAIAFMLFSSLMISIADVLLKYSYISGIFWGTFLVFSIGISLSSFCLLILKTVRKDLKKVLDAKKYIFISLILLSISFGFTGQLLFNKAISLGPVTLVSVFVSFQSLFVLLIATFLSIKFPLFIKEAIDAKTIGVKLIAIALMAFGLFLLVL